MINRLLILFAILLSLLQCGKAPDSSKVVCLLFDLSESTNRPEIRKAYVANAQTILKKMKPGDALLAALITEQSISELHFGLQYEFPKFKPSTDNLLIEKRERMLFERHMKMAKDSLQKVVDSLLMHQPRPIVRTEILSALQGVERVFKNYNQNRKILVIFSDMIEDSDLYNFTRERLNEKRILQIIDAEQNAGRIPDLRGVKVYVVGAMANKTKLFLQIRNFWIHYFEACGAQLENQNYGPTLIRFDE